MAVNAADVFIGVGRCFLHHLSRKRTADADGRWATANTNMRIVTPSPPLMLFAKTIGSRASAVVGIDGGGEGIILGPGRVLQDCISRGYDDQAL